MDALRAAAQNGGVAGLEAERAGIGGHVRPALVDDADDPERHRDAGDSQPVGALPLGQGAADGVGPGGNLLDAARPRLDALRSEEHTSELQSPMRNQYADLCMKKKQHHNTRTTPRTLIRPKN